MPYEMNKAFVQSKFQEYAGKCREEYNEMLFYGEKVDINDNEQILAVLWITRKEIDFLRNSLDRLETFLHDFLGR